jgi:hypothetical protein
LQGRITVERPDEQGAEYRLAKNQGNFRGREVGADLAASLAQLNHLCVEGQDASLEAKHGLANLGIREKGQEKNANDVRIAHWFLCHERGKRAHELGHGLGCAASFIDGEAELCELHFGKGQEDVVLAGEIVEKGAFAHVGSVGDVFNCGFGKTLFGEQIEGGMENTFAKLNAAALAAVGGLG